MARQRSSAGSRQKLLDYFAVNLGRVLNSDELRQASGNTSEWARRVRELRTEYGYQILTHNDRSDLKPGEYLLETLERIQAASRNISRETRAFVLERDGYTCQTCGSGAGDPDPYVPSRKIRLTLGHIVDKSRGGSDEPDNLRAICMNCNEGLQNTSPPRPDYIWLIAQLRRAPQDVQRAVYGWLKTKFLDP